VIGFFINGLLKLISGAVEIFQILIERLEIYPYFFSFSLGDDQRE
jgi:hypothetical protein